MAASHLVVVHQEGSRVAVGGGEARRRRVSRVVLVSRLGLGVGEGRAGEGWVNASVFLIGAFFVVLFFFLLCNAVFHLFFLSLCAVKSFSGFYQLRRGRVCIFDRAIAIWP